MLFVWDFCAILRPKNSDFKIAILIYSDLLSMDYSDWSGPDYSDLGL
jgi:hypothetical protein